MAENRCNVCNQAFNSDRELQEHQQNSHSSDRQAQKDPLAERDRGGGSLCLHDGSDRAMVQPEGARVYVRAPGGGWRWRG